MVHFAVHGEEHAFSASRWPLDQNGVFCVLVDTVDDGQFMQQLGSQQVRIVPEALILLHPNLEVFLIGDQLLLRGSLPVEQIHQFYPLAQPLLPDMLLQQVFQFQLFVVAAAECDEEGVEGGFQGIFEGGDGR